MRIEIPLLISLLLILPGCRNAARTSAPRLDLSSVRWAGQDSGSKASLRGLCAVDGEVAWAGGANGTVLRTIDGGATWQHRPIEQPGAETLDYRDVHAFDADRAIVLSAGLPARIYMTEDGGESWTQVYANDAEGVFFDAMAFWDDLHGLAFSDPVHGRLLIIATEDGGKSWREIESSGIPPALSGEAGFAGSGTCLALTTDPRGSRLAWIGLGGDTGESGARIFHTADGGRSWNVSTTSLVSTASSGIFSLAFRDHLNGVMVGGDFQQPDDAASNAAYTKDGGRTWRMPAGMMRPRGYRSVVCYLPHQDAYLAGGPSGTDYSIDDGRTWTALGGEGFHVISVSPDAAAIWAAGADGRISKLSPAGN